jgi:DNA-binding CsgD family transcriptional regulator
MGLLSERELEVVRSLAEGLTNREIGERLGLSRHTVKNYLFRIFDKIGVSSRMELLHLTLRQSASSQNSQPMHDPVSDFELCRKEAEDGSPQAQVDLAERYRSGQGTAKDNVAAYMWTLLSERALLDVRERANAAKAELLQSMNSAEILEAQQRASAWLRDPQDHRETYPLRPIAAEKESAKFSIA